MNHLRWLFQQRLGLALSLTFSAFWFYVYYVSFIRGKLDSGFLIPLAILPSSAFSDAVIYAFVDPMEMNAITLNKMRFAGMLVFGVLMFFAAGVVLSRLVARVRSATKGA